MSEYLSLLFAVANDPARGRAVTTPDPETLRSRLYAARRGCPNPDDFAHLSILISPTNPKGELWIVKTSEPPHAQEEN